jgi:hypothetical protein
MICVGYRDHVVAGDLGVKYSDMSGRIAEKMVVFCCKNYYQCIWKKGLRELL